MESRPCPDCGNERCTCPIDGYWIAAIFAVLLLGCAQEHGRIEGLPLYVHLCYAMSPDDSYEWGKAAGEINVERGDSALWVGHGPPTGCNTVDVCPGSEDMIGDNGCTVFVRYVPGGSFDTPRGWLVAALGHAR